MKEIITYAAMSPIEKLNFFRNRYYNDGNSTELGIVANAINDVIHKLEKMSHLKAIEYTLSYSKTLKEERVAVFDDRLISEDAVLKAVKDGGLSNLFLDMSVPQYQNIFQYKGGGD